MCVYAFQRNYTRTDTTHTPHHFKSKVIEIETSLCALYDPLTLIVMGDFQHTILDNALHRMGKILPAPPGDILTPFLQHPFNIVSFIPTQHPTLAYHTRFSKPGSGQAGLDHILIEEALIHKDSLSEIDHEISASLLKTDHHLGYSSVDTHSPNTAPTPPTTVSFQYRKVAHIPLRKTYPKNADDPTPLWFAPKTIEILPSDVRVDAKMHDALAIAHDHPKAQAHLHQMMKHLASLDFLTATLYMAHLSKTPRPDDDILIPRTPRQGKTLTKRVVAGNVA